MNEFLAAAVLIMLLTLRFAIPAIVIMGIAFILDRLQLRWKAETGSKSDIIIN